MAQMDFEDGWHERRLQRERVEGLITAGVSSPVVLLWSGLDYFIVPSLFLQFFALRAFDALVGVTCFLIIRKADDLTLIRRLTVTKMLVTGGIIVFMLPQVTSFLSAYVMGFSLVFWGSGMLWTWPVRWSLWTYVPLVITHLCLSLLGPWSVGALDVVWSTFYITSAAGLVMILCHYRHRADRETFMTTARLEAVIAAIGTTATELSDAVVDLRGSAAGLRQGTDRQARAIEDNQSHVEELTVEAQRIATSARGVAINAEQSQENGELVAERIDQLAALGRKIDEVLTVIKEIADKSDLLALNGSLEASKAGAVGRGFMLVSDRMHGLAAEVVEAVDEIRDLTSAFSGATNAAVVATGDSVRVSSDTTVSARQIAAAVERQEAATEQVASAVTSISLIADELTLGGDQVSHVAESLTALAERLQRIIDEGS